MGVISILKINLQTFYAHKVRLFAFAFFLLVIVILASIVGSYILTTGDATPTIQVAIVDQDNSFETSLIMSSIANAEEYQGFIYFTQMNESQATVALAGGYKTAVITFPPYFGHAMTTGGNIPFEISYNVNQPLASAMVRIIADSFADMLRSSQIGVYTTLNYAWDAVANANITLPEYDAIFWQINLQFLNFVLTRHTLFAQEEVYATNMPLALHYFFSAYIFLMMCSFFVLSDLVAKNFTRHNIVSLKGRGVGEWQVFVGSGLAYFVVLFLISWVGLISSWFWAGQFLLDNFGESWVPFQLVTPLALVCFGTSVFGVMVTFLFKSDVSRGLFVSVFAIVSLFLSGGIVPFVFLPAEVQSIATFVPSYWALRMFENVVLFGGLL